MHWWAEVALLIIAAMNVLGLITLLLLALGVYKQIRSLNEKARSVFSQSENVLGTVKEVAVSVGEQAEKLSGEMTRKAEHIAGLSEQVAERIAQRVETTTTVMQEAVTTPAINLASLRAGISRSLTVWHDLAKSRGGNGK